MSRIRADRLTNKEGTGAPLFPNGIRVVGLTSLSNVVAGVTTFTSDVSIGGTLTYEDVTNIDSVGMVTARSGIDINAGGLDITAGGANIVGVVTAGSGKVNIDSNGNITAVNTAAGGQSVTLNVGASNASGVNDGIIKIVNGGTGNGVLQWDYEGNANRAQIYVYRSDQELRFTTAGGERLRIGAAGQLGIAGANYGTSGQVMTSQGGSAAPQWADAGGGAWEVVQSTALSGSNTYLDFNGWSNSYQKYQLVFSDIYWTSEFRIYCRFYKDATSGNAGTLQTASQYKFGAISNTIQNSGNIQSNGNTGDYYQIGKGDYGYLWNGYLDFPMRTWTADATYTGNTCIGLTMRDNEVFPGDACFYDTNKSEFLTGIRLYFFNDAGNAAVSPTQGRFTILRMKYS